MTPYGRHPRMAVTCYTPVGLANIHVIKSNYVIESVVISPFITEYFGVLSESEL